MGKKHLRFCVAIWTGRDSILFFVRHSVEHQKLQNLEQDNELESSRRKTDETLAWITATQSTNGDYNKRANENQKVSQ